MSSKTKYEILRVSGNGYMIDDPNGCEVVYRETSRPFGPRRGESVTYLLERIDELEEANEQLETQVEELKDARDTPPAKGPWQPIETAPKDGTWIFVWCMHRRPDEDSYPVAVVRWGDGYLESGAWGKAWRGDGGMDLGWYPDPTHWMPIPKLEVE